jgi:DNA repair protein RadC
MPFKIRSEDAPPYGAASADLTPAERDAIEAGIAALRRVLSRAGAAISAPADAKRLAVLEFATEPYEVFAVFWLDTRHRLMRVDRLFRGTIDGASVHPREVVRAALGVNAAACILVHNHPSGVPQPSRADELLTKRLKDALALIDVRVLDHLIVGGTDTTSFAERGLI